MCICTICRHTYMIESRVRKAPARLRRHARELWGLAPIAGGSVDAVEVREFASASAIRRVHGRFGKNVGLSHAPRRFSHRDGGEQACAQARPADRGDQGPISSVCRDRQTVGELASETGIDRTTLSRLLTRMQSRGLLRRLRTAEDHRTVRLSLTKKGGELAQERQPTFRDYESIIVRGISQGEVKAFK